MTPEDSTEQVDSPQDSTPSGDSAEPESPLPWTHDACEGLEVNEPGYAERVDRWTAQDALHPPAAGQLVGVGSSSMRRWEGAALELTQWGLIQRGFGGAQLSDVAGFAPQLVAPHSPAGVLVFAGTNDISAGVSPEQVVERYRCLAQQVHALPGRAPLLFIGITPTPSRWGTWPESDAVNQAVQQLSAQHPDLHYVDIPQAFLRSGSPPDSGLFVEDMLHLSPSGYALWTATILPVLQAALPEPRPVPGHITLASGTRLRVDLGPSNPEDGAPVDSPDGFGHAWNSWSAVEGGEAVLAGEHLGPLVDIQGNNTGVGVLIAGGFRCNGALNGGLQSPSPQALGELAVPQATVDYFYTDGADSPGALVLTGLDPQGRYTLRLFASRDWGDERRVTRYTARGQGQAREWDLLVSGPDVGAGGYDGNTHTLAEMADLQPTAWGELHLDVSALEGSYAYLSLLELLVQ